MGLRIPLLHVTFIFAVVMPHVVARGDEVRGVSVTPLKLEENEICAFVGGTNLVRLLKSGYLETLLTRHFSERNLLFRDFTWEADTVYRQGTVIERWRKDAFGNWSAQLKRAKVTLVFVQFGQMESLRGANGLAGFQDAYTQLLAKLANDGRRVVVISPTPFEKSSPLLPDLSRRNTDLQNYVRVAEEVARDGKHRFVNIYAPLRASTKRLTSNGVHITPESQPVVATAITRQLGLSIDWDPTLSDLRSAIQKKHRLWFDYWRPANWKCLFGDDGERIFGRASGDGLTFRQEWGKLPAMLQESEAVVRKLAVK